MNHLEMKLQRPDLNRHESPYEDAALPIEPLCNMISQDTEKHDLQPCAYGGDCFMCPVARRVGLEPTTSALGARITSAVKTPHRIYFLRALPIELPPVIVGTGGIEPPISCISDRCLNQLGYVPAFWPLMRPGGQATSEVKWSNDP